MMFNIMGGFGVTRTASIGIRVEPDLKKAAEQAAAAERRTLAAWIEGLIVDALAKRSEQKDKI